LRSKSLSSRPACLLGARSPSRRLALRACLSGLSALVLVGASAIATGQEQGACSPEARAWAARCADSRPQFRFELLACPEGGVTAVAQLDAGEPLHVEIASAEAGRPRTIGRFGLAPIGEFPDWSRAPAAQRAAFEAVCACAQNDPSLPLSAARLRPQSSGQISTAFPPWRLLLGLALAAYLFLVRSQHSRPSRVPPFLAWPA
jgi:hypothetical protein